jgi:hypothetical protein
VSPRHVTIARDCRTLPQQVEVSGDHFGRLTPLRIRFGPPRKFLASNCTIQAKIVTASGACRIQRLGSRRSGDECYRGEDGPEIAKPVARNGGPRRLSSR